MIINQLGPMLTYLEPIFDDVRRGKISTLKCPPPDFQYRFQAISPTMSFEPF